MTGKWQNLHQKTKVPGRDALKSRKNIPDKQNVPVLVMGSAVSERITSKGKMRQNV
jgi:hypothetical protein